MNLRERYLFRMYAGQLLKQSRKRFKLRELAKMFNRDTAQICKYVAGVFIPSINLSKLIEHTLSNKREYLTWHKEAFKSVIGDLYSCLEE